MSGLNLKKHYTSVRMPNEKDPKAFFTHRFMRDRGYHQYPDEDRTDKNRSEIKKHNKRRFTTFTGGNVYMPYEMRGLLMKYIALDIENGTPMYLNQVVYEEEGEGCRLMIDVDSDVRVVESEDIKYLGETLAETLKAYFKDYDTTPIDIFCARCGPRIKKGNLSTGIHFVCHVNVTIAQAKQIIHGYEMRLNKKNRHRIKNLVFDSDIYKDSGQLWTRPIYSHKVDDCPMCKGSISKQQLCTLCDKLGRVISTSTYTPYMMFINGKKAPQDQFALRHDSFESIVSNYYIWPTESDTRGDYNKPDKDPDYTIAEDMKKTASAANKKRKRASGTATKQQLKRPKNVGEAYVLLAEFLHEQHVKSVFPWDGIEVTDIKMTPKKGKAYINVSGMGSSWCVNSDRDHGTNRISFHLFPNGRLEQHCFCKKKEEGYNCSRKDKFTVIVPKIIVNKVFGKEGPPSLYGSGSKVYHNQDINISDFMTENRDGEMDYAVSIAEKAKQDKQRHKIDLIMKLYDL